MRVAALCLILLACGGASRGPAWPKQSVPETDGGESIAPRPSTAALSEADEDDVALDDTKPDVVVEKTDDKKPETPTGVTPPGVTPDEVPITTEEIIIEIGDPQAP
jgi:hypothetical protein